jgi:hypothetical protein
MSGGVGLTGLPHHVVFFDTGRQARSLLARRFRKFRQPILRGFKQRGVVLGNPNVGKMNTEAAAARDA